MRIRKTNYVRGCLFLGFMIILFKAGLSYALDSNTPDTAFNSFIKAVQAKNVDDAFMMDSSQIGKATGKFKQEIEGITSEYAKLFDENPSICPGGGENVPCDGRRERDDRNIIYNTNLLIPKDADYKIIETVYSDPQKSKARILVKVSYTEDNGPILVSGAKTVQIYTSGFPPIPPLVIPNWGILTKDNVFLSNQKTTDRWEFPIEYTKKNIKEAEMEITCKKLDNKWVVEKVSFDVNKLNLF